MKFDAAAAREFANSLGYLDGAGPEVRLWLHNAIDAASAARAQAIEDAAQCAVAQWMIDGRISAKECVAAIRALAQSTKVAE